MTDNTLPSPLRSPALEEFSASGIRHGFFTRAGGVSQGIYRGLNTGLGSNDDSKSVIENRKRVANWMGVAPENLLTVYQIHSADALIVDAPFEQPLPKADAMVTNRPGIALGALAADCGPVLYADPKAGVIGAAHAGWGGAFRGILEATIEAMEKIGAHRENITATLGPSISQKNYEVGPEFIARFINADANNEIYFIPSQREGHFLFDLNRYTVDRLAKNGVKSDMLNRCTYAEEGLFYSYRRATHKNEPDYGRQISAIVLEKN